ncbi:SPOR domain-containing protein [Gynuella sp.]|uniref:SPOR domain-containing protein n=1 Tax=Gynuella sp. TaxID=2969146 RepID=UPI003D0F1674
MEDTVKRRVVGAVVLAFFAVLIVPTLLDGEGRIPEVDNIEVPPMVKKPDTSELMVELPVEARKSDSPTVAQSPDSKPAAPKTSSSKDKPAATRAATETQDFDAQGQLKAWSLQIASFRSTRNAAALRDKLRQQGYRAYNKESILSDGSTLTQVFIGPESSQQKISILKEQLTKSASELGLGGPPLIVRYRPN